jgi:GT2 family glycosyltransferase
MKILAVVVTHNRATLLLRCIEALMQQSRAPDEILVVNNASTDNTLSLLSQFDIQVLTQENLGSAGGWYAGLDYAVNNDFDFCWLMDDDGYPDPDALVSLEKNFPQDYACLSSIVLSESDPSNLVFPMPLLNYEMHPTLYPFKRKIYQFELLPKNLTIYPFAHLFNGALILTEAVKKIGNINKNYFIMGDEVDYFYRLREYGKVGTLLHAKHYHPDVSMRPYSKVKIYYLLKNTIINHSQYMDHALIRNIALLIIIFLRVLRRNGPIFLLGLIFDRKLLLWKAMVSALNGQLGKDYQK